MTPACLLRSPQQQVTRDTKWAEAKENWVAGSKGGPKSWDSILVRVAQPDVDHRRLSGGAGAGGEVRGTSKKKKP